MGLIHKREYEDILSELAEGLLLIEDFYVFFEMDLNDWESLSAVQRQDLATTLGDDIFFALDKDPSIQVGMGVVEYIEAESLIKVSNGVKLVKLVKLT